MKSVDTRVEDVNKKIGRKYLKNFVLDAPVVTIMPGQPKYLPGEKNKEGYTQSFLEATVGSLGALKQISADADLSGKDLRLYDFQWAYIECMQYVNVLCRACASFLELDLNKEEKYYNWYHRNIKKTKKILWTITCQKIQQPQRNGHISRNT